MDTIPSPANVFEAIDMHCAASRYLADNVAAMTPEELAEYLELLDQTHSVIAAFRASLLQELIRRIQEPGVSP
jgi:hypothetical protein